jgi:hypothetical protein
MVDHRWPSRIAAKPETGEAEKDAGVRRVRSGSSLTKTVASYCQSAVPTCPPGRVADAYCPVSATLAPGCERATTLGSLGWLSEGSDSDWTDAVFLAADDEELVGLVALGSR